MSREDIRKNKAKGSLVNSRILWGGRIRKEDKRVEKYKNLLKWKVRVPCSHILKEVRIGSQILKDFQFNLKHWNLSCWMVAMVWSPYRCWSAYFELGWAWHGGGELGELWVFVGLVDVEGSSWADVVGWACAVDEAAGTLVSLWLCFWEVHLIDLFACFKNKIRSLMMVTCVVRPVDHVIQYIDFLTVMF